MRRVFSETFKIAGRSVGWGQPIFIVAEAGVAHFGSLEKARAFVDLAVLAGADAIKFQIFKTNELVSQEAQDWIERLKPKELPFEGFQEIQAYCREKGIIFFATAHDEPSLEFLDSLDVPVYKIGSGEVANWPFLEKVASGGKPVILSTGMYTLEEIGQALATFAVTGNPDVAVLHCVTRYPTPAPEVNLRAMQTIQETFDVFTGYSDHTEGIHFPLAAATLGAKIIEKHISLDFNVPNAQDWMVSCGSNDLPLLVKHIRDIEVGLGSGIKAPSTGEQASLLWARKSLVAARDIREGEVITADLLQAKRPGTGIPPARFGEVVGRRAKVEICKDRIIRWEELL
jgi:N-acetylneuraminate synthase/N,N'-diacetyllegionaminate synthase